MMEPRRPDMYLRDVVPWLPWPSSLQLRDSNMLRFGAFSIQHFAVWGPSLAESLCILLLLQSREANKDVFGSFASNDASNDPRGRADGTSSEKTIRRSFLPGYSPRGQSSCCELCRFWTQATTLLWVRFLCHLDLRRQAHSHTCSQLGKAALPRCEEYIEACQSFQHYKTFPAQPFNFKAMSRSVELVQRAKSLVAKRYLGQRCGDNWGWCLNMFP